MPTDNGAKFGGRRHKAPVSTAPSNFAASEDKRRQMHPRIVNEPGDQKFSGPKPTKGLFRGGERIS